MSLAQTQAGTDPPTLLAYPTPSLSGWSLQNFPPSFCGVPWGVLGCPGVPWGASSGCCYAEAVVMVYCRPYPAVR